ncbi:MAG: hypothetical protein ACLFPM_01660 [Candidatus Izemoplasmatales bacterium]
MKNYLKSWKILKEEVGSTQILDALFASLFYTLLILLPVVLIFAQVISMFYYLLNLWVVLIMLVSIGLSMLQLLMWKKAILLKKTDVSVELNHLFIILLVIYSGLIVLVGLLFIYVFIPIMQI